MYGKSIAKTSESIPLRSGAHSAIRSGTLVAIMAIIAVLVPAGLNVELDSSTGAILQLSIICMLWTVPIPFGINNPLGTFQNITEVPNQVVLNPFMLIGNIPLTFLRLVFVYQIYKLYQGRTTRKHTMLVGAASELQMAITGILGAIMPVFSLISRLFIPIPILFLAAIIAIKVTPPSEISTPWKHSEDTESWWTEPSKDEEHALQTEERLMQKTE